jgi:DNA-binding NtrC family response regulator
MTSYKILVVDDSATARAYFDDLLRKLGHQPSLVEGAQQALEIMDKESFDLILSDLVMPGMDGIDLLKEVRRRHPEVAFLIITSYASLNSAIQAVREGADDYITRPVADEILAHRLGSAMARQQANQLRKQRAKLEAALAMAGAAAHEINQPLSAVLGAAELMGRCETMEELQSLAQVIAEQTFRLGKITNSLVHLVRFQTKPYVGGVQILDLEASTDGQLA